MVTDPILLMLVPIVLGLCAHLADVAGLGRHASRVLGLAGTLAPGAILLLDWERATSGSWVSCAGGWAPPMGEGVGVDAVSLPFLALTALIGPLCMLYALSERSGRSGDHRVISFLPVMCGALCGVFCARDLFNLYVFFELTLVATYVLVAASGGAESAHAAFQYLVVGSAASALTMLGVGVVYASTGLLDYNLLREASAESSDGWTLAGAILVTGDLIKSGVIPFHGWLPTAHASAPTSVSALLSGVTVKVGAYILVRLAYVKGTAIHAPLAVESIPWDLLAMLGGLSALVGAGCALSQVRIKRMLGYHTVSQMGLVVAGLSTAAPACIEGGLLHIVNHGTFKALAFLVAGAAVSVAGTDRIPGMRLGLRYPVLLIGFVAVTGSICGLWPFGGAWSKGLIPSDAPLLLKALEEGSFLLTAASFTKAGYYLFASGCPPSGRGGPRVSWDHPGTAPILLLSGVVLALGIWGDSFRALLVDAEMAALGAGPVALQWHLLRSLSTFAAGCAIAAALVRWPHLLDELRRRTWPSLNDSMLWILGGLAAVLFVALLPS